MEEKPDLEAVGVLLGLRGWVVDTGNGGLITKTHKTPHSNVDLCIFRDGEYSPDDFHQYLAEQRAITTFTNQDGETQTVISSLDELLAATESFVKLRQLSVVYRKFYDVPNMTKEEKAEVVQLLTQHRYSMDEKLSIRGRYAEFYTALAKLHPENFHPEYSEWQSKKGSHLKRMNDLDEYQKEPSYVMGLCLDFLDGTQTQEISKKLSQYRMLIHQVRIRGKRYQVIPDCWAIAKRGADMVLEREMPFVF